MNRSQDIELRLADWLEEGPDGAPDAPIAAALEHARAHPRRRWSAVGHWRTFMNGTNMARVGPKAPQAGWLYAAAAVLVIVVVVAGGYGIIQSSNQGSVGGVASPVPTATASPEATPATFTGSETCAESDTGTTTTVNGVVQIRDQQFECSATNSDSRFAGNGLATMNWDEYPNGTSIAWGTRFLANDGGVWRGVWNVKTTAGAGVMEFRSVLVGEGGYEGLVAPVFVHVSAVGPSTVRGTVLAAEPAINGHETCGFDQTKDHEYTVGDITAYRGVVGTCTDTMSDPRLSGTGRNDLSIDMRPDRSADIWGKYVLTNDGGTWEGYWAGTVDEGYTTHRVESLLVGTGDYEGFLYRLSLVSDTTDTGYDLTGLIVPGP